jgi:hypothetical protein
MELLRSFVKSSFTTAHGGMAWIVMSMLPAFSLRACQKATGHDFVPHGPVGSFFVKYMPEGAFTWFLWLIFAGLSCLVAVGFYNATVENSAIDIAADPKPKRQRKKPEASFSEAPPTPASAPTNGSGAYADASVEAPEFGSLYRS